MAEAHDAQTKAAALAALAVGGTVRAVARQFGVSHGTLIAWRNAAGLNSTTLVRPEKRDELGELLSEYLRANIAAITAQALLFADKDWLSKQNAHDVAVLHGVLFDKQVRLLEAVRPIATAEPGAA